jgi:hypothetical protein
MRQTTYDRYDGRKTTRLPQGGWVEENYVTTRVTFVNPRIVEKMFRYLRKYHPQCKYLLDWNPIFTPSFGHILEFSEDFTYVTLRSKGATAFLRAGNVEVTWPIRTRFEQRVALRGIADYFTWYASVVAEKKAQRR